MRTTTLHVRMTKKEYEEAIVRAQELGVTLSEFVRKRVLSDCNRPIIKTDQNTLKIIYSTLRKCGGLLNQACHTLNRGIQDPSLNMELNRAMSSVANAAEDISRFIADARNSI